MKKNEIKVGGRYWANVSGKRVKVEVLSIADRPHAPIRISRYQVRNLATGRVVTIRSAQRFLGPVVEKETVPAPVKVTVYGGDGDEHEAPPSRLKVTVYEPAPEDIEDGGDVEEKGENDVEAEAEEAPDPHGDDDVPADEDAEDAETVARPEAVADRLRLEERAVEAKKAKAAKPAALGFAAKMREKKEAKALAVCEKTGRKRGDPIPGIGTPNDEQEEIIAAAIAIFYGERKAGSGPLVIVGNAGAGTGKTHTERILEWVFSNELIQYSAYNKSIVLDSKSKFKHAACDTSHSLAFRAVGHKYKSRIDRKIRMRSSETAARLGIESYVVTMPWDTDSEGKPRTKLLSESYLAGQVIVAVKRFCQSAAREVGPEHINLNVPDIDEAPDVTTNRDAVKQYLLPFCRKAWADLSDPKGTLPFFHDVYVKAWQLGTGKDKPVIPARVILYDEFQDMDEAVIDILRQQDHAMIFMAGDEDQIIYEWRNAKNAANYFPGAPTFYLSQSYRYGQAIADIANCVLALIKTRKRPPLRGHPDIPSRICQVENPRCYLYRTNAGAVSRLMLAVGAGKKAHLIGGGKDVVEFCQGAIDLKTKGKTEHPDLACFDSWEEVKQYSETDEGQDLALMVKLIDKFGAQKIKDAVENMPEEKDSEIVISTAHKSKGREWDTVKLGSDFPTLNRMEDADVRLLYVAATRARHSLDVTQCPPFCGGNYLSWGEGGAEERSCPGLNVVYTKPMPTAEEQEAWLAAKAEEKASEKTAGPAASEGKPVVEGEFTFAKWNEVWHVRGPKGTPTGSQVTVRLKDGRTKNAVVKSVVKEYDDACIYGI